MTDKKPQSFWNYHMPISQSSIDAGRQALNEDDPEYAKILFDNAKVSLDQARSQTQEQIEKRNSGNYDPSEYYEHWHNEDVPDSRSVDREECNARERAREPDWFDNEDY